LIIFSIDLEDLRKFDLVQTNNDILFGMEILYFL
jgi:hypothetical protein